MAEDAIRRLIVCADDFAVHPSASLGIVQLARCGRISATSAMVLSPHWSRDVALLQGVRERIDVGLHLDWTSDFALASGHGMTLGRTMRQALLGGFDQGQARRVIDHQLDLFESHWGDAPDFVDGHQHVQQFDGIRQALVEVLARRYAALPRQPYVRISRAAREGLDFKSAVISAMGANALEKIADHVGIASSGTLFGIYDFQADGSRYAGLMKRWLRQVRPGSILMCHPALAADPGDALGATRWQEFTYLSGSDFAAALQQARVRPARGHEVLSRRLSQKGPQPPP